VHKEGWDFVTVGFSYRDGQFQCVDTAQCVALGVPQEFKVDLN